jgi:CysZ protein
MTDALSQQGEGGPKERMKGEVKGFAWGFASLFRGAKVVYVDHRELARFYFPPMILALCFVVGAWVFFWLNVNDVVGWVWAEPKSDAWFGIKHFFWGAVAFLLWIILAIFTALATVFLFQLFAAPFSDFISERVEGIAGTWNPRDFSFGFLVKDLGQTIAFELIRFGIKLMWLVPLFLLSLIIPVIGHLVYVGLGGYFLSKYTGMDYIDWCAARRGWTWKERLAFAKKHRFALCGLGTGVVISFMIPLLFVLVWPAAVAGGALLFGDLHGTEEPGNLKTLPTAPSGETEKEE